MESALADVLIGRVLDGRYLVRSRIAHGGMATVYLGTDVRLDRQVALKVMHAELARDADFVNRFIGEAKSVARLSHPNIVAVFDQGADGQFLYLAMEYVPGRTLRDLLRERGWVPYTNALDIMDPILSGLAAAHRAGFVHRDVKPENVLLTDDGRVKVVDFGLARASATSGQTRVGQIIGTVAYIAPEQVTGGTTDFRTDVYAAGIMLFEMLTGRQPHTGESPLAVAYKHVNEEVPPPSVFVPGLPNAVDDLVRAATSRDPRLRPADADSFLQAARSVRAGRAAVISSAAVTAEQPVWHDGFDSHHVASVPALPAPPAETAGNASHTMVVSNGYPPDTYGGPGYGGPGYGPEYGRREPFLQRWLFSKRLGIVAAGLIVVAAAGLGSWYFVSGRYAPLPAVTGQPEGKAISMLRADGFAAAVSGSPVTDNNLAKGDVISTSPSGRAVKGARIALTISAGPRMVAIPSVTGQTSVTGAESVLQKAGLSVSATTNKVASSTLAVGAIAGTTPPANTSWPVTKPVSINVVAGFPMPNLVQQNINGVQGWANQNSITLNQQQVSNNAAVGTIIAQSVPPNSPVAPGSTVNVQVSSGPPEVQIPNGLTGQSFNQVQQTLTGLGFQVNGNQFGPGQRVLAINPTGQAPKGSTITVWYGF
jgi:beta-lactam-binding protein with PASTA domain